MKCDKCGKEVDRKNSVIEWRESGGQILGLVKDRHLYPTQDCEGSPSRVKIVESDKHWGKVYAQMQATA